MEHRPLLHRGVVWSRLCASDCAKRSRSLSLPKISSHICKFAHFQTAPWSLFPSFSLSLFTPPFLPSLSPFLSPLFPPFPPCREESAPAFARPSARCSHDARPISFFGRREFPALGVINVPIDFSPHAR